MSRTYRRDWRDKLRVEKCDMRPKKYKKVSALKYSEVVPGRVYKRIVSEKEREECEDV